jgi:3-dehydroquinate synthase
MITIRHSAGAYQVRFISVQNLAEHLPKDAFIVTDENVRAAWGARFPCPTLAVPPGEASKSVAMLERVCGWLAEEGATRSSTLVALGGGMVGDLAGFAAATYMRGIRYLQAPTSLLAQVDSSVGGKVAVDLPQGKNLVGAFYPPEEVAVCLETLTTLPERELKAGAAEVWKYGFIMDPTLLESLSNEPIKPDSPDLRAIVQRCVELKAEVVEEDEFETTGRRAILNFGHTVGHAIEAVTGYGPIKHGEAVAIGMVAEARIGELLGVTKPGTVADIQECMALQGLPTHCDALRDHEAIMAAMRKDKKKLSGDTLAFSFLISLGECKLVPNVQPSEVEAALKSL